MKKLLTIAACLYFFIAPLTYHPDNKLVLYWSGLEQGSVWNIWTYGTKHFGNASQYNYPPVHYYLDKLQYFIAKPIAGAGFDAWLSSQNSLDAYQPKLSRFSLAIKTPLLIAALLTAWFVYALAKQKKLTEFQATTAAALWLFNPITLYSVPVMGQNDVLAILFFLAGWYTIGKNKWLSMLIFGAAASVKLFPLFWLAFVLALEKKLSIKDRVMLFIGSIASFALTLVPFLHIPVFRAAVLGSDMNQRFTTASLHVGFSDMVYVVPVLILILMYAVVRKYHTQASFSLQLFSISVVSLILLGFSHFHVQWYTWIAPFWAVWMTLSYSRAQFFTRLAGSLIVFVAWLGVVGLFADTALTTGIFMPLAPHLVTAPIIRDALTMAGIDAEHLNNLAHTALAAMALVALISLFHIEEKTSEEATEVLPSIFSGWHHYLSTKTGYLVGTASILIAVFFTTVVLHMVPLARSTRAPQNVKFFATPLPHSQSFVAPYNGLYYLQLQLKNPGLVDRNDFSVQVSKKTGEVIASQVFNGFNIGDPSTLRFNIPPEAFSKNQEYVVTLSLTAKDQTTPITLGYDEYTGSMAIHSFYQAPKNPVQILTDALIALQQIIVHSSIPTVLVCVLVCAAINRELLPINRFFTLRK